jgi:hypothetical protein
VQEGDEVDRRQRPVEAPDHPSALVGRDPVLVGQNALRPETGVVAVGRELADDPTRQVLWLADPAGDVDVNRRVSELAIREHRQRQERWLVEVERPQKVRPPQLGHVELAATDHALEDLGDDRGRREGGVDTVDADPALEQRTHVVVAERGDLHRCAHCRSPPRQ